MEKSEGKENHMVGGDTTVGGKSQVVILYEMCIFNRALDGRKATGCVCVCSGENVERKEARHNTP